MSMAHLRFLNPPALSKPPTYSHVVEITGPGKIIYIAGQLGLGVDGRLVGESGDFRAQAKQTFENLKGALAAVGATFDQVVKLNSYLTDITHLAILREVRDEFINTKAPPASTTLQISRLAHERALIEIEAVAALPLTA
jgi:enamine deaminase RidA (YjgF/YER057c/UK114 family)